MKPWQKALGDIRLLGPDIPRFRDDVKLVHEYIEHLERALRAMCDIIHTKHPK